MAFSHEDTDAFYANQILPVLRQNKIKPIIINRRQSNDDLNIQIFEQLEKADFCIADLTYTRPSVYFEAGFAQRTIPVIYTVRKDHLNKGQPDDRRVHFDLQMKPLITWDGPTDKSFSTQLEARIKSTFLREWSKKQKTNQNYEIEEKNFRALPADARLMHIRRDAILAFKRLGFGEWSVHKRYPWNYWNSVFPKPLIREGLYNYVYGYKSIKNKHYFVSIQSFSSPTKKELLEIDKYFSRTFPIKAAVDMKKTDVKGIHLTILVLSLVNISSSRIENAMPHLIPLDSSKHDYKNYGSGDSDVHIEYYFLSGIRSKLHLKELLNSQIVSNYSN